LIWPNLIEVITRAAVWNWIRSIAPITHSNQATDDFSLSSEWQLAPSIIRYSSVFGADECVAHAAIRISSQNGTASAFRPPPAPSIHPPPPVSVLAAL